MFISSVYINGAYFLLQMSVQQQTYQVGTVLLVCSVVSLVIYTHVCMCVQACLTPVDVSIFSLLVKY